MLSAYAATYRDLKAIIRAQSQKDARQIMAQELGVEPKKIRVKRDEYHDLEAVFRPGGRGFIRRPCQCPST